MPATPRPRLIEALEKHSLALFIGADLPQSVTGLPSRAELARDLARRYGLDDSLSLAGTAERVGQAGSRFEFTDFLRNRLDTAGKHPAAFHQQIVRLTEENGLETLITCAYDDLLERAFQEKRLPFNRMVRGSDASFIHPGRPTLVKLYGDASQPETLVVTERDHSRLVRDVEKEALLDEVQRTLRRSTVLFVGYDLSDPVFRYIYDDLASGRFARTAFAVWPGLPDADIRMWQGRGIVIIDQDPFGLLGAPVPPTAQPQVQNSELAAAQAALEQYQRQANNLRQHGQEVDTDLAAKIAELSDQIRRLEERLASGAGGVQIGSISNVSGGTINIAGGDIHQETRHINTGGGAYIEGNVNTGGGDFIAGAGKARQAEPGAAPGTGAPSKALEMARRALEILEEQAAGYTTHTIPVHVKISLEDKRREVAEMEERLGIPSAQRTRSAASQPDTPAPQHDAQEKTDLPSTPAHPTPGNTAPASGILIVTATKVEAQAVLNTFAPDKTWKRQPIGNHTYYSLGQHGEAPAFMVQSEMGTATPGGAMLTVRQAIQDLRPQAVVMCGIAFGLRRDKQKLGDILISKQLQYYEPQKVDQQKGLITRGDRATASERLLDRCRSADIDWEGAPVHFGLVMSGEKLVNDPNFRDGLLRAEPEAIGGEMEGAGLYAAAREAKVDWILIKAICDWGDGKKNDKAQQSAAQNAAQFVLHVVQLGDWGTAGYVSVSPLDNPKPRAGTPEANASTPTTESSSAKLRQQINLLFDDAELTAFCLDHFAAVYDRFSRGMRKDEKITLLLDHCRRRPVEMQRMESLLINR